MVHSPRPVAVSCSVQLGATTTRVIPSLGESPNQQRRHRPKLSTAHDRPTYPISSTGDAQLPCAPLPPHALRSQLNRLERTHQRNTHSTHLQHSKNDQRQRQWSSQRRRCGRKGAQWVEQQWRRRRRSLSSGSGQPLESAEPEQPDVPLVARIGLRPRS